MSELFGPHDTLVVYSFMYGPERDLPCPGCTHLLDGIDGAARHIGLRASLHIVAKSSIARLAAWAHERGWNHLSFVSTAGNSYDADYFGDTSKFSKGLRAQHHVPDGENWHALKTIEFRLSQGSKVPFWLRWDEATNTFSACAIDNRKPAPTLNCTPGQSPGSFGFLQTEFGVLDLSQTTVVGSGPTGPSVLLNLAIIPDDDARGHYDVELAASNDSGSQSDFFEVGNLRALPAD
jgi:hypothetical protein